MKYSTLLFLLISFSAFPCTQCVENKDPKQPFIASSGIPFETLMKDSMHLMDAKMDEVNLKQSNERIFLEMMIAHHQGALDMANGLLVHTKNKELQNYAKTIVAAQYNEILYMKTLLQKLK